MGSPNRVLFQRTVAPRRMTTSLRNCDRLTGPNQLTAPTSTHRASRRGLMPRTRVAPSVWWSFVAPRTEPSPCRPRIGVRHAAALSPVIRSTRSSACSNDGPGNGSTVAVQFERGHATASRSTAATAGLARPPGITWRPATFARCCAARCWSRVLVRGRRDGCVGLVCVGWFGDELVVAGSWWWRWIVGVVLTVTVTEPGVRGLTVFPWVVFAAVGVEFELCGGGDGLANSVLSGVVWVVGCVCFTSESTHLGGRCHGFFPALSVVCGVGAGAVVESRSGAGSTWMVVVWFGCAWGWSVTELVVCGSWCGGGGGCVGGGVDGDGDGAGGSVCDGVSVGSSQPLASNVNFVAGARWRIRWCLVLVWVVRVCAVHERVDTSGGRCQRVLPSGVVVSALGRRVLVVAFWCGSTVDGCCRVGCAWGGFGDGVGGCGRGGLRWMRRRWFDGTVTEPGCGVCDGVSVLVSSAVGVALNFVAGRRGDSVVSGVGVGGSGVSVHECIDASVVDVNGFFR